MFESDTVRNARIDAVETAIGTAPIVRVYNGTAPADETTALSGNTLLAQGTLPSDWLAAAVAGVKSKSGAWTLTGQAGAGAGTAGTFLRIFDSTGTTSHMQMTFTATGGGGEATIDNNSIANAQSITINTFTLTAGN